MRFMTIDTCEIIDSISGGKINKPLYFIIKLFYYMSFKILIQTSWVCFNLVCKL